MKELQPLMNWFDYLACLKLAEEVITKNKFHVLGRKLHCWTPQLVVIRKWHRRCLLLLRAIKQGNWLRVRTFSSKMIASRLLVEEKSYDPEVEMDISRALFWWNTAAKSPSNRRQRSRMIRVGNRTRENS